MGDKRQKNQLQLAFWEEGRGEAPKIIPEGTESSAAKCGTENPAINVDRSTRRTAVYGPVRTVV